MNDFELAANNVGNRFDLVLIASERMRELYRKRLSDMWSEESAIERKNSPPPCVQAIQEIENKNIGREYLEKIKTRTRKKKPKFDEI
jgi:DNA-directed RNA polymerase omega subunit